MSLVTTLCVTTAAVVAVACVAVALRARARLATLGPASFERDETLGAAGFELERRAALRDMGTCIAQLRAASRIALASGTATAVFVLANGLASSQLALTPAAACFTLGALGSTLAAQLGRLAREDQRRFHAEWNRSRLHADATREGEGTRGRSPSTD